MKSSVSLLLLVLCLNYGVDGTKVKRAISFNPSKWKEFLNKVGNGFKYATIYPGTKWCGKGDIASNKDQLGTLKKLDRCCRAHDLCGIFVKPGKTYKGVKNTGSYTWSHCDCDDEFYSCLKKADNTHADVVGVVYFTLLGNRCIYEGYPKKCKKFLGIKVKCKKVKKNGKKWLSKKINRAYA